MIIEVVGGKLPTRATSGSAAYDLYAPIDGEILPGQIKIVPLGIRIQLQLGQCGILLGRSSLAFYGQYIHPGLVDSDFGGILALIIENRGSENFRYLEGDRIG